jgi:hypothetical protein
MIGSTYLCLLFIAGCNFSGKETGTDWPAITIQPSRCTQQLTESERLAIAEGFSLKQHRGTKQINKEEAIIVANGHLIKSDRTLNGVNIIVCETVDFWHISYDGAGLEYFVSKYYTLEPLKYDVQQGRTVGTQDNRVCKPSKVSRKEAIEIAKIAYEKLLIQHGSTKPDAAEIVKQYNAFSCELAHVWRVVFEYKELPDQEPPNAHPPLYTIDKDTGMIIQEQLTW